MDKVQLNLSRGDVRIVLNNAVAKRHDEFNQVFRGMGDVSQIGEHPPKVPPPSTPTVATSAKR